MKIVRITEEKIDIDDPFFGGQTMHQGRSYLVHDLLLQGIMNRDWGTVVGDESDLRHLPRDVLKAGNRCTRVLLMFHGGLGDAISAAILLGLLEREYNLKIDVSCTYDVWCYVLRPMGFRGKRLPFPVDIEAIEEYDYIQTDVTNFIPDQTRRWERCIMEELAAAYQIDIAECRGDYSVPVDALKRMKMDDGQQVRIGVSFESKGFIRNYPDALAGRLISLLVQTGLDVYRLGTRKYCESPVVPASGFRDFSGKTNVFELAALLKQMDIVIGMDSFPVHLSNILGVRTIALLSATKPGIFRWHENVVPLASGIACSPCGQVMNECPEGNDDCKAFYHESISPERILGRTIVECQRRFRIS